VSATVQQKEALDRAVGLGPKIQAANATINTTFVDRGLIALAFWLAVISDRTSFLFGPPGVAKTAVASFVSKLVTGMSFYEELMPVVVSPEQLLVAETELVERVNLDGSKSVRVQNRLGLAAGAHLVLLDEVWKAQPAVLKVLFDLLLADGVRLGGEFHETPTLGVLAASNELPESGCQLEALWARMAFRFSIMPLDRAGKIRMLHMRREQDLNGKNGVVAPLTLDDLHTLQAARKLVEVSDELFGTVLDIYEALLQQDAEGFRWLWEDDRRLDMVREGLQAHALMNGRAKATKADLAVMRYMLWNTPEQIAVIEGVLAPYVRTPLAEAKEMLDVLLAAGGKVDGFLRGTHPRAADALSAVKDCIAEIESKRSSVSADELVEFEKIVAEAKSVRQRVVNKAAGI